MPDITDKAAEAEDVRDAIRRLWPLDLGEPSLASRAEAELLRRGLVGLGEGDAAKLLAVALDAAWKRGLDDARLGHFLGGIVAKAKESP